MHKVHVRPAEPENIAAELAGDWRLLLLVGTGLMMQVTHPVIGGGVGEHSTYASDPYGRFIRSVWPVLAMVLIEDEAEAEIYGHDLRAMHRRIQGVDHVGRSYHAWNPEAGFLVLATALYASEKAADLFGKPINHKQRAANYAAWRQAGLNFGVPERSMPADRAGFDIWLDRIVTERLEDHPTARELLVTIKSPPPPSGVPTFLWKPIGTGVIGPLFALVTVGTLPPALRETLGLEWTRRDERKLAALARVVRTVNVVLPRRLRQISAEIVRRKKADYMKYVERGAALGIAPSIHGDSGKHTPTPERTGS